MSLTSISDLSRFQPRGSTFGQILHAIEFRAQLPDAGVREPVCLFIARRILLFEWFNPASFHKSSDRAV